MTQNEIIGKVDHTLLKQQSTWEEIKQLCDQAILYGAASVCIPPCYVKRAHDYVQGKMKICTVIGFPNGNCTTAVKEFETQDAIKNGAEEIDMVINIGQLREGNTAYVLDEIKKIKKICGSLILKVIIETCLLTEEEKVIMCRLVTESNADYIKTSTGFSSGGATFEDIRLFRENVGPKVKIKAAGGISSFVDAERFIELGAERLGTSRIIKLASGEN